MKPARRCCARPASRATRGQSMVDYLVASAIVVAILAVPYDGSNSVIGYLLSAVRTAFARFLGAISLPM